MQTPLQQPRPEMPEAYSDSFNVVSQHEEHPALVAEQYPIPPSPEVAAHAEYITRLTRGDAEELSVAERPPSHALSSREYAQRLRHMGVRIMDARRAEVEQDLRGRNGQ